VDLGFGAPDDGDSTTPRLPGVDTLIIDYSGATGRVFTARFDGDSAFGIITTDSNSHRADYTQVERFNVTTGTGAFNDDVMTGNYDDVVSTGAGDDRINAQRGVDLIAGGAGVDALLADKGLTRTGDVVTQAVLFNLNADTYSGPGAISGIEVLESFATGAGDDVLVTTNLLRRDVIGTREGNDTVTVAGGHDNVDLGLGAPDDGDSATPRLPGMDTLIVDYSGATGRVFTARFDGDSAVASSRPTATATASTTPRSSGSSLRRVTAPSTTT
jgi:hypothetical protein